MNRLPAAFRLYLLIISTLAAVGSCSRDPVAGGSGSTTTNGFAAAVRDEHGKAVAGAVVHVRPHDYCATGSVQAAAPAGRAVIDTITGTDGTVELGGLFPGSYTIEIQDAAADEGVLLRREIAAGPVIDLGVQTTSPLGIIGGYVDTTLLSGSRQFTVQVYGLERRAAIDPVTGVFTVAALPPGWYAMRLVADDTTFTPVNYDTVQLLAGDTVRADPFALWAHTAILSIDVAAAQLAPNDTVVNFPLLLRLGPDNFDFSTVKKKGGDFRVAKVDGTNTPFEIEWWDSAGATASIWILVDTLYGSRSRQTLNLCWGNRAMQTVSSANAVFDSAAGFCGVWHLNESGGTVQKDATAYQNNAVPRNMDGSNDIIGIIGRAQRFDGEGDSGSIGIPATAAALSDDTTGAATLSFWVKIAAADSTAQGVIASAAAVSELWIDRSGSWEWTGSSTDSLTSPATAGIWTLLTAVRLGSKRYLYVNGAVVDSGSITATNLTIVNSDSGSILGCRPGQTAWFTGVVDELRFHRTAVSASWIRCCYEVQREDQRVVSVERLR